MRTKININKIASSILILVFAMQSLSPFWNLDASSSDIIYPLKEVAKLECRFNDFSDLSSDCIENLPILYTKDYVKYATQNGWYNDYTRRYTVLWWSSYTYGWDIWNGWHMWVDIATSKWTPVYAIANWTVIVASNLGSLGNTVAIRHTINWKTIVSSYSHLSKINVSKWDNVSVGRKVWEVGSTGNSTWNHLHFQIDIDTKSSPVYYSSTSCPYSYYQITEQWVCFKELQKITVDPLLFLETSWAILSNLPSYNNSSSWNNNSSWQNVNINAINRIPTSIFSTAVNVGSSKTNVTHVQTIMFDLGYYKWALNWDYDNVYESIIDFQIARWVISNRNDDGAGNWWPKTRTQAKEDYIAYANTLKDNSSESETETGTQENNEWYTNPEQVIIEKDKLMTREEIEAKEVQDFIKWYTIDLQFQNFSSNISLGAKEILNLTITDARWKPFIWNMPWGMTFVVDTQTVDIFPTKLFAFTDWKREIEITWLKEWTTKLYIKIGTVTVKTFDLNIYNWNKSVYPEKAVLIAPNQVVLWDTQTALAFFRDSNNKLLVNMTFGSTFKLKASEWNKVCIKRWNTTNFKTIVNTKCLEEDFVSEQDFTYEDTVNWILVFDYKTYNNKNSTYTITNTYNNTSIAQANVKMTLPKWLTTTYEYSNEVITMLEKWIATGMKEWYFRQDDKLTEYDAYEWVINASKKLQNESMSQKTKSKIEWNINKLLQEQKQAEKYIPTTRKYLLDLSYKYLVLDETKTSITITYRDLSEEENKIANYILANGITWKDQYDSYFQPSKEITRWEAAFMIASVFNSYKNNTLTLK